MSDAIIDPDGIVDKLRAGERVKLLRQSNIGSFDICAKRAGYDMRPNQPRRSGEARCVGTAYHAGLEHFYRSRMRGVPEPRKGVTEAAMLAFQEEAALFTEWVTTREESWERTMRMLDHYFNSNYAWPDSYEVLAVEQEWFLPLFGEWYLKGSIDLVLRNDEGVVLADHKTAGRKWDQKKHLPEKQTQAVLYSWAWWRATGEVPICFFFDVMTYKGEFDRRPCPVEAKHMQVVLQKAMGVASILDTCPPELLPGNPSSNLCSALYCDHFHECPFGFPLVAVQVPESGVGAQGGAL